MKRLGMLIFALLAGCAPRETESESPATADVEIKLLDNDTRLTIYCDAQRGNLVYITYFRGGTTRDLFVMHQPESCPGTEKSGLVIQ